jgi:hypothetical protein
MNVFLQSLAAILASVAVSGAVACATPASVCAEAGDDGFALIAAGRPAAVVTDPGADSAVRWVADRFAADLERVSGHAAQRVRDADRAPRPAVVIGVPGQSPLVDALVAAGKLEVGDLEGQWEAFRVAVVDDPWPGVSRALVVAGSDRRGAVFGTFDLSEQLGVSPWYWWADVPTQRQSDVRVIPGSRSDRPRVRYRGFFINDEDPAFSGWAKNRFGGVNADLYEQVFELLLRLKGNYLWPAMWAPKAFHLDDPRNTALADAMGVVMGTSHHEPMTRAQSEWHRSPDDPATGGPWNYLTNADNLRAFWRGGIERMMSKGDGAAYESLVTIGMRGDGDEPMAEDTAIGLLETIVADQRRIIEVVTGRPASQTPQVWALYKEVQDYYDRGMTVPDDVTLLFADDNWGQIRRLPEKNLDQPGGFGVYYHFDYVGGPRNYKWLNTVQIGNVWQQMDLAYQHGARNVWIVNVGDIKPMEFPLDFFLRMAWNPEAMTHQALAAFPETWAKQGFGAAAAAPIGELITRYSRYAARRKPELVNEQAFPIGDVSADALHRGEFGEHVENWRTLVDDTEQVKSTLGAQHHDAYFQLVEFPILALANLYELYWATAWNRRLASSHDPRANFFLHTVERTFARDAELTARYHALNGGKWDGMMNQVHMNYVIWNEPTRQTMPSVTRVGADTPTHRQDAAVLFAPKQTETPRVGVIPAAEYARAVDGRGLAWTAIPYLGRSQAAMVALPQSEPPTTAADGVRLEYSLLTASPGDLQVRLQLSPTLDTTDSGGIRIGVSLDDGPVQTVVSHLVPTAGPARTPEQEAWSRAVIDNRHVVAAQFAQVPPGGHTLKIWRLDDNVALERIEWGEP